MITRYLISYDIADPDRLRKVHRVVKARAERVQFSVYEALLTDKERVRFEARLRQEMNQAEDQVLFVDLGSADRKEVTEVSALGRGYVPRTRGPIVI